MPSPDPSETAASSAARAAGDRDLNQAPAAAAAVVSWWRAVSNALAPVLGTRGVVALYQRSLHLAAGRHPFLGGTEPARDELDLPALQALLSQQPEPAITAAGATLAAHLSSLLEGLVGPSLTRRLLQHVQPPPIGGSPAQD